MLETVYLLLNVLLLVAVVAFTGTFITAVSYGKELNGLVTLERREFLLEEHRWHANGMLWSLFIAILSIEIKVRLGEFADRAPELFWAHLSFAIPLLLSLLLLRFKITGKKNLSLHKKSAYTSIALFIGTAITGSMLFFNF